ncbi:uncharacterized protein PHACADRAFT_263459 [Phanerochaete carnosa HHB-10118-sp]|uniref:Uncharacterized protein n=1 Tax=Phanerochaete carnosa (strain HHB-10118-sp) TaxID=650164 RepID=K5UNQ2_PHACS|nr:uncharacterized protein PHACADRAFT_263459 [Phanerochaete carnosa HHB-10118-sp]EKM51371.1 hypothetical protein PHACADRAFT_263459 [Phanerochaete carnosa HHB-10118-sp]
MSPRGQYLEVAKHSLERYSSRLIYPLFSALLAVIGTDLGLASVLARGPLERRNYRKQELEGDAYDHMII